jgi:FkbM family methyltransferase
LLKRLLKPWFVHRPMQLIRRVVGLFFPVSPGYQQLSTSWGVPVWADPARTIGRSIATTGIYEIAISEALVRLITPGDTVIDAGANIGYMTLLAAVATGEKGKVFAFEPHPALFAIVEKNISSLRQGFRISATDLHNTALGELSGKAELILPDGFDSNDGVAHIAAVSGSALGTRSIQIQVETLDDVLRETTATVLKIDVEGYEFQVLRGAVRALEERRIRHIIFEDHNIVGSRVMELLRDFGYRVYALGWSLDGIVVHPVELGSLAADYEAPNFIASIAPEEVLACCEPKGWRVLNSRFTQRCSPSSSVL